jgi:hypothetical protein
MSMPVKVVLCLLVWVIGIAILSPVLFAQWPSHATAGAPRTADEKVDLTAPTPKAPDGHPDLSGVWDRGVAAGAPMASRAPASPPSDSATRACRRIQRATPSRTAPVSESPFFTARWFAISALGRGTSQTAFGGKQQGSSRRALSSAPSRAAP